MNNDYEPELSPRSRNARDEEENIYVITRTGKKELLDPLQIVNRLKVLIDKPPRINHVNAFNLMQTVIGGISSGISTYEIDEYTANVAASLGISNPYYLEVASRLAVDNHRKIRTRIFG